MDLGAITSAATALQTAGQIVKSLISLKVGADVQAKVIELQTVIVSAQGDALAAQSEQLTLLQRVRTLEAEVAQAKAWDAEKGRYQLTEFPTGVFAYVLKADAADGEPTHRVCATCFQEGHKSILQVIRREHGGEYVQCNRCKSTFLLGQFNDPPINYDPGADYY